MERGERIGKLNRKGFMRGLENETLEFFLFKKNGYEGFDFSFFNGVLFLFACYFVSREMSKKLDL